MINSDQTLSKYVQVGRFTMALKVVVAGIKKQIITLTLTVIMDGKALTFQAIYMGKAKQSLPKVTFSSVFSLSAYMEHHSITQEVLKHLKEIVIPYVKAKQKTEEVTSLLKENKIV